ncbi:hypothetical protein EJB05_20023, partial [Eragrostis curvula]
MEDAYGKSTEEECAEAQIKLEPGSTEMEGHPCRGSPEEKALTFELVSRHFGMPINQAAKKLNVGLTVLKKRCRELGIPRWPHRKLKSLQMLIDNVQELGQETEQVDGQRTGRVVEMLEQTKKLIEERPEENLDKKTRELRQACYKMKFERKRLMDHGAAAAGDGLNQNDSACLDWSLNSVQRQV